MINVGARWLSILAATGAAMSQAPSGAEIYRRACATCHEQSNIERMPQRHVIASMSPESILAALTTGVMRAPAASLSPAERRTVAEYLTGKTIGGEAASVAKSAFCDEQSGDLKDPLSGSVWNGWGVDSTNTRYQPNPGFSASDVPSRMLKKILGEGS